MAKDPNIFPPIRPEHAAAIGYVAAHWSLIEEHLAFLISNTLGLHAIPGWAVTAELSTIQRVNMISALIDLSGHPEWINEWAGIIATFENLRNRRNDAVHSTSQVVGPAHWTLRIKAKGRVSIKQGPVYTPALQRLSDEILELEERIAVFDYEVITGGIGKIINQLHPPGWPVHPPTPRQSRKGPAHIPKRERRRRRRAKEREK